MKKKHSFKSSGYLDKKGTPNGPDAQFNHMPPGQDIDKQPLADIRPMPYKQIVKSHYD